MGRFPALPAIAGEIFWEKTPGSSSAVTLQLLLWGLVYHLLAPNPQLGTPELLGCTLTIKALGDTLCSFIPSSWVLSI